MKRVEISSFRRYAEAPDFKFRFDDCYFPHEVDTSAGTFSPRWTIRNEGEAGTLVFGFYFLLPKETGAWALWQGEVVSGAEVTLVFKEPIAMWQLAQAAGISVNSQNELAAMVWLTGYLTREEEEVKYITVTDFWLSFTYILPWGLKWGMCTITCDGREFEFDAVRAKFVPEESYAPVPPETVRPDTPIDFDIRMLFWGVHDPFDFCDRHWTLTADAMELQLYYNDKGPITVYRWATPLNPPTPGTVHRWRSTKTIEELIGEAVEESGMVYLQFILWFDIRFTTDLGEVWHLYYSLDWLGYSVPVLVAVPAPRPVFVTELCYFCPDVVGRDDSIEPVFVVDNLGERGDFYIACLYAGMWRELFRGTVEEGERYTHRMPTTTIYYFMSDYFGHEIAESQSVDLTFYAGHFEPDKDPSETWDSRWVVHTWVEVPAEPPPPPPEGVAIPTQLIVAGVTAVMTIGTAYIGTRRK